MKNISFLIILSILSVNLLTATVLADSYQSVEISAGNDAISDCYDLEGNPQGTLSLGSFQMGGDNFSTPLEAAPYCVIYIDDFDSSPNNINFLFENNFKSTTNANLTFDVTYLKTRTKAATAKDGSFRTKIELDNLDFGPQVLGASRRLAFTKPDSVGRYRLTTRLAVFNIPPQVQRAGIFTARGSIDMV